MTEAFLYTLSTGAVWTVLGIFLSIIAKKNISIVNMAILYTAFSAIPALFLLKEPDILFSGKASFPGLGFLLLLIGGGIFNTAGMLFLQFAMKYGKSGPAWTIGQSALLIPFLSMWLIFGETLSWMKLIGTLLILTGMFLLGRKTGNTQAEQPEKKNWRALAFTAFLILGTAQSMQAASAYTTYRDPHMLRPLLVLFGAFLALGAAKIILREKGFVVTRQMLILLFGIALFNFAGLLLLFLSIDAMGRLNLASSVYPLAVGSCIAGFCFYSMIFLKEKATAAFLAGIALILCGIAGFCF